MMIPSPPDPDANPYAPPRSVVAVPAVDVEEAAAVPMKRPASTKWVMFWLGMVVLRLGIDYGRAIRRHGLDTVLEHQAILDSSFLLVIGFVASLFSRRSPWFYYSLSAVVVVMLAHAGHNTYDAVTELVSGGLPLDQALVVMMALPLLLWLAVRFILGRPSREYYRVG